MLVFRGFCGGLPASICLIGCLLLGGASAAQAEFINLAAGKPASASGSQAGHVPANAVDDDPSTRWCSPNGSPGASWQVDLEKPQDLTGCRVMWEFGDRKYQYKVEGSADGKNWAMLSDQTQSGRAPQLRRHDFAAKQTRYVRLTITGLDDGAWGSFFEVEVFGTQPAPAGGAPKKAKPTNLAGVKAPKGFDVTLFAAPPEISYPTCLCCATNGDLFVGVDENGSLGAKPARGRIVRCTDTDGDGQADKFLKFCELDSPRGLVWDQTPSGGVLYVLHPPKLSAFHDTNGDGVSDRQETLVDGIGFDLKFRGADHTTNGMQLGIDGFLYVAVGDYGFREAKGTDGRKVQLHGGGIARVRTDGSELAVVSRGQRNIYDVAIDPQMNLFTRDNTNDGGGWNVRLSHVPSFGHMGYPSLYINYPDEMIPALADYGGGSPCGSLFLDEPGLPAPYGRALYTCDWGRSIVYRHPLTPRGATFQAEQVSFLEIPRPTDMEVDGQSRLYVSSWRDGGFDFSHGNVGFVVRVTATDAKPAAFPNVIAAKPAELLEFLKAPSHTLRLAAQREMLRRGPRPEWTSGLEALAASNAALDVRTAAIFTLAQLDGVGAQPALVRLAKAAEIREAALRAYGDRLSLAEKTSAAPLVAALADSDPRVRLTAVSGLARLDKREAAAAVIPLVNDADPVVAHIATRTLGAFEAGPACLVALDAASPAHQPAILRTLRLIHSQAVAAGLIERLASASVSPALKQAVFATLCRLYQREAPWDGKWWGTRPDTAGPYFRRETWEASPQIAQALQTALASAQAPADQHALLVELVKLRVELPEVTDRLLALASADPQYMPTVLDQFAGKKWPDKAIALAANVAADSKAPAALRARSLRALHAASGQPAAAEAALAGFAAVLAGAKSPELTAAWEEYSRDTKHAGRAAAFVKAAESKDHAQSELGYTVLLNLVGNPLLAPAARDLSQKAIDRVFTPAFVERTTALPLVLKLIGDTRSEQYGAQVRELRKDPLPAIKAAAEQAAAALGLDKSVPANQPVVARLEYDKLLAACIKEKGDPKVGARLFVKQGCINCHTITKGETLKGPYLGDIGTRYKRPELLESIVKPSAKIAQGFEAQWFQSAAGKVHDGFIVRESGDEIELRTATGVAETLKKVDIDERGKREISVMPQGLVDKLTPAELSALVAFLETLLQAK